MPIYQVWRESYFVSGADTFEGEIDADSFREACIKLLGHRKDFDPESLRLWGIPLYDNEADSRKPLVTWSQELLTKEEIKVLFNDGKGLNYPFEE